MHAAGPSGYPADISPVMAADRRRPVLPLPETRCNSPRDRWWYRLLSRTRASLLRKGMGRAELVSALDHNRARAPFRIVKTAVRAPRTNAYAERRVRSVRRECLDWILIWNRRHLERVLSAYVAHYNLARPHRGLDLEVPVAPDGLPRPTGPIERVDVLGGLIHEYQRAA